MLSTSYHTHNRYCDGTGAIEEYAHAAAAAGLEALGVSSHGPVTFPDDHSILAENLPAYCADVERARAAHAGRLRVHLSLEFEFIPELHDAVWRLVEPYPFDYLIGSVHFVRMGPDGVPLPYDLSRAGFEEALRDTFGGDPRKIVGEYYARVRALAAWGRTAIIGHLDRIKMWNRDNRYFDEAESWYRREIEATLDACAVAGVIVELNTSGWRHEVRAPYPSPWIVRRCVERGIPLVVTADAHAPNRVALFYPEAEAVLRESGCQALAVLRDDRWVQEPYAGWRRR
jgi:histidinol-phosphatase (PHP family)